MSTENTIMEAIGIEIVRVSENEVVATMPVNGQTKQPFGILHGGASLVLAETVASLGTFNLIDQENELAVGLEINANHVRAKSEGAVTATGTPLHQGRKIMVWDIRVTDEGDKLICVSRCTVAVVPKED
ncbi:MAG: hotdog fold thioesterase [Rubrobacteraceae bacterium]